MSKKIGKPTLGAAMLLLVMMAASATASVTLKPLTIFHDVEDEEIRTDSIEIKTGNKLSLTCHDVGNNAKEVTWYIDSRELPDQTKKSATFFRTSTFEIKTVGPRDDGKTLECRTEGNKQPRTLKLQILVPYEKSQKNIEQQLGKMVDSQAKLEATIIELEGRREQAVILNSECSAASGMGGMEHVVATAALLSLSIFWLQQ